MSDDFTFCPGCKTASDFHMYEDSTGMVLYAVCNECGHETVLNDQKQTGVSNRSVREQIEQDTETFRKCGEAYFAEDDELRKSQEEDHDARHQGLDEYDDMDDELEFASDDEFYCSGCGESKDPDNFTCTCGEDSE